MKTKKCLILGMHSSWHPYDMIMQAALDTWDTVQVDGIETILYCDGKTKATDKVVYFPVQTDIFSIGKKTLLAFEWALKNKEFDYISRPQSNAYINKKELFKYIQELPDENVFEAIEVVGPPRWRWGVGTLLSRDVVQKLVDNKDKWDHRQMEDVAMSELADRLGIPYRNGRACSIDKVSDGVWQCTAYGSESFQFTDFSEIHKAKGQYWFRCKQDYDRNKDEYVMQELYKQLK